MGDKQKKKLTKKEQKAMNHAKLMSQKSNNVIDINTAKAQGQGDGNKKAA